MSFASQSFEMFPESMLTLIPFGAVKVVNLHELIPGATGRKMYHPNREYSATIIEINENENETDEKTQTILKKLIRLLVKDKTAKGIHLFIECDRKNNPEYFWSMNDCFRRWLCSPERRTVPWFFNMNLKCDLQLISYLKKITASYC